MWRKTPWMTTKTPQLTRSNPTHIIQRTQFQQNNFWRIQNTTIHTKSFRTFITSCQRAPIYWHKNYAKKLEHYFCRNAAKNYSITMSSKHCGTFFRRITPNQASIMNSLSIMTIICALLKLPARNSSEFGLMVLCRNGTEIVNICLIWSKFWICSSNFATFRIYLTSSIFLRLQAISGYPGHVNIMSLFNYTMRKVWLQQTRIGLSLYDYTGQGFLRESVGKHIFNR